MDDEPQNDAELDSEPQTEAESDLESTQDEQAPTRDQFFGTSFRAGRDITVSRARFRNIITVNQAAPGPPSDFRRIRIGDLDLRNEIRLVKSGEVLRQYGRRSVRRVYSAQILGFQSNMTVAVYQGDDAEQEWWEDVVQYSGLRHPNLMQLFGMASACGIHAAIFNDELIPVQQLFEKYSGSHLRTVHLWNFLNLEFDNADKYIESVSGKGVDSDDCTMWIRPSTGRLCVDPTANDHDTIELYYIYGGARFSSSLSILEPPEDTKIVDSISLERYHEICYWHFDHHRQLPISTNVSVQLGAVILCPPGSELEHPNEIACIPDPDIYDSGWRESREASQTVLESGWTRVDSSEVSSGNIFRQIHAKVYLRERAWLAQANHIFHRLGITSNHDDYVLVDEIFYTIRFATGNSIPPGYLFLCPLTDLQADSPSRFRLPECPAYWSLDPTGDERLSMEEAEQLGFPRFNIEIEVWGSSWDKHVYTGLRQFHQGKGFDPDSQEVALELRYPLFEISAEPDGPFAHIQELDVCDDIPDSGLPEELVHGECGLNFHSLPPVASTSATAHRMYHFGTHKQQSVIDESFDPRFFGSSSLSARSSQNLNNFNFNFEFPLHDQPYALPPLEPSTLSQLAQPDVARGCINWSVLSGPSGTQFLTPPPSLWTSFPRLPPIPAPSSPFRLPNPIAAHLDHLATSRSGKRKSRDDDPATDIAIDARRPRKMPTRSDLWGV